MTARSFPPGAPRRVVLVTTIPATLLAFFVGLARHLAARGWEVHAVTGPGPGGERFAAESGARVHVVPTLRRRPAPARDAASLAWLVALFARLRPQVVHAHTPKAGLLGMLAARAARVPARVYTVHGLVHETRRGMARGALRRLEAVACGAANKVLCVSGSLRDQLLAERVVPPGKVTVLGQGSACGVDPTRFRRDARVLERAPALRAALGLAPGAFVLGYVGRLARDKGIADLAQAWPQVRSAVGGARLLLVGPEDADDPLPGPLLHGLRADPSIVLTGFRDDVPAVLALMDALVLPSHREGFGLVLLEAAAMEVATIATSIPGCRDAIVDGETGLLVPRGDPSALADAALTLARDAPLRQRLGQAGRRRALALFAPAELFKAHEREYRRLLGDPPSVAPTTSS